MPLSFSFPRIAVAALALPLASCMAYSHADFDTDRTPIVNVGSRASVIYPGQSGPAFPVFAPPTGSVAPGNTTQRQSSQGGSTQSSYADPQEVPPGQQPTPGVQPPAPPPYQPPRDPNAGMTLIGGAREDITTHKTVREDPLFMKYLTAPLAVVAAPFVMAKEAIQGDPEPGPPVPRAPGPQAPVTAQRRDTVTTPAPAPQTYEQQLMREMERELAQREQQTQRARRPTHAESGSSAPRQHASLSIADELDALQRVSEAPQRRAEGTRPPERQPAHASEPEASGSTADGIVDRNDDGRIDQWIYRDRGEIVRQELDEDFDGRVDRIVHVDLETHQVSQVEEDNHGNGVIDTWTEYRDGAIARRRSDSDADGSVDTWSFYRAGELARHEQDTTHDGYRDAISFYADGRRVRETRDLDFDGQHDTVLFFDANDRIQRQEEDRDRDGFAEVISHYRDGRLVRRELLDAAELAAGETESREVR